MARPKKTSPTAEDAIKLFELHPDYPRIQVRMRERMEEVRRNMSPAARGFGSRERLEHVLGLLDIGAESFCDLVSDNRTQNAFMILLHRMELDTYQEYTGWPIERLRPDSAQAYADLEAIHAKTQWWTKKGYERLEKLSDAGRKITRKQIWTAAGKPTTPNPADLGLLVPGTEEHNRIQEALEANWKAEQADPERRRKNQRRNADLQAAYDRRSELPGWRYGHEKLIRDARKYAESCLAKARSPNARLKVTRRALKECIGRLPNSPEFPLSFEDLHKAIWTEGHPRPGDPSLEERAERAAEGGFPKEELAGDMKPGAAEPAQRPAPNADQVVPAQPGGKVGAPWDNVEICFLDADHAQVTVLGQVRRLSYAEMGFGDRRGVKVGDRGPNKAWGWLRKLAEEGGSIDLPERQSMPPPKGPRDSERQPRSSHDVLIEKFEAAARARASLQAMMKELRRSLCAHFGIGDNPILFERTRYHAQFQIGCSQSYHH
jgi:hypothetical protein